jgi:tetratricopeptide (TPR) repeat protein
MRPGWLCQAAVLTSALVAASAHARDGGPQAEATAREHAQKGATALREGRYDDAMKEFEAGYAAVAHPGFVMNMGHVQRQAGNLERARGYYRRFLQLEPKSSQRAEVEQAIAEIDAALKGSRGTARTEPPRHDVALAPAQDNEEPAALKALPAKTIVASPAAPPPEGEPFYTRWWFWGGVAALLAAGALAFIVVRSGDDYTARGSWGTLGQ